MIRNFFIRYTIFFCCLPVMVTGCRTNTAPQSSQQDLQAHLYHLVETVGPRPAGSPKEQKAADYVYDTLASYGYEQEGFALERMSFDVEAPHHLSSENIMAVKKGEPEQNIVAIVAHYDSMPETPGARDNAGGVAALLQLSKLLKDVETDMELRFIALGAEEIGYWGSLAYLQSLSPEERDRHIAVYNMDITVATKDSHSKLVCNTLGGKTQQGYIEGNFLEPANNLVSRSVADAYQKLGYSDQNLIGPVHYGDSDHVSFHQFGIDAANVCWRIVENDTTKLPAEYHLPQDNLENLDYQSLETTVACIREAIFCLP